MFGGKAHGDWRPLGRSHNRKPVKPTGICHRFHILSKSIDPQPFNISIRQAGAALVIADHSMALPQRIQRWPPNRAVPVKFKMGQPVACSHDRRARSRSCISNLCTVLRICKSNSLTSGRAIGVYLGCTGGRPFFLNRHHHLEPAPGNGFNDFLVFSCITHRLALADSVYSCRDGGIRYNPTVPDLLDHLILCHQISDIANQQVQQIKNLRFDGNCVATTKQFVACNIKFTFGKKINHRPKNPVY